MALRRRQKPIVCATASLVEEHRALEVDLDRLAEATAAGDPVAPFRALAPEVAEHYRAEEPLLAKLARSYPVLAGKILAQHAEAGEIAARLEEAIAADDRRDILALARRFHAIVQHNLIEEERDVFPLADRCSGAI